MLTGWISDTSTIRGTGQWRHNAFKHLVSPPARFKNPPQRLPAKLKTCLLFQRKHFSSFVKCRIPRTITRHAFSLVSSPLPKSVRFIGANIGKMPVCQRCGKHGQLLSYRGKIRFMVIALLFPFQPSHKMTIHGRIAFPCKSKITAFSHGRFAIIRPPYRQVGSCNSTRAPLCCRRKTSTKCLKSL